MERIWEIDAVRGTAIVLMVVFNYAFAFAYFGIFTAGGGWAFWWLFPRVVASMFIIVSGISFTLSASRPKSRYKKFLLRGGKLFALGLLVTLATWTFVPGSTVFFGILHFLGIAIIIAPVFRKFRYKALALGIAVIAAGIYMQSLAAGFPWLLWLGITPNLPMLDYFPLLPWFGIFLLGIFAGNTIYAKGKRKYKIAKITAAKPLSFLGRHSLLIYVLHIPLLIAALLLFGYAVF